ERAGNGDAALDVGPGLGQGELDPGERRRDVEHVEVADVPDSEDLALQRALAGGERDPEPVAEIEEELRAVDGLGAPNGRDNGGTVVVGREELEAHRPHPCAARTAEPDVVLEDGIQTSLEQEAE